MIGPLLHIAVAVIVDGSGRLLIARRPPEAHQGGLWEFPGGKVEAGETILRALRRELKEELGINLGSARPLIKVCHAYADQEVLLDVWRVDRWHGSPRGCEGQPIAWVKPEALGRYRFPEADKTIITAATLPPLYLISPALGADLNTFLHSLEACMEAGARLFQLRDHDLPERRFRSVTREVLRICHAYGARLIVNTSPAEAVSLGAHGVHLTSSRLLQLLERPLAEPHSVAASCHNAMEVEHAGRIGADFIVVSPVRETASHPQAKPLGWRGFEGLAARAGRPVFALGGMAPEHLPLAWQHGGHGIAMISSIWGAPDPALEVRRCIEGSMRYQQR